MKNTMRVVTLITVVLLLLTAVSGCNKQQGDQTGEYLTVNTVKVIPDAYLDEPYDLREVILMEDGVAYSASAVQTEITLNEETGEFAFAEIILPVEDLCFTPTALRNTVVTITATRGEKTASKKITVGTVVRADPMDDLFKSTGSLGFADPGISKSVNMDPQYIKGENSATSLHVKYDGTDAHAWGNNYVFLSDPAVQKLFTDQDWKNAIVTCWIYNPMDQDIEFQLVVNDATFPVMLDWTGIEGSFRRQYAKAGEWTQIFFSLRRMGTTHKLVTDSYSTESLSMKVQYCGYSMTESYQFDFYMDDLDVVPGDMYPEVDTTYTASNETMDQGWENMSLDTGWQGASTIYVYDEMMGDNSTCSLFASFDSDKGVQNPFVVLNPEQMLGGQYMTTLPDMTGGTLTAYFKFENCTPDVKVDLVKYSGKDWLFSNALPMELTSVVDGWYQGSLNVNNFDFGTDRNDGILRIRFTFSGISISSKVWIDTVKFDYKDAVKVRESIAQDWINLPADSGMNKMTSVIFSTDYKKAPGSVRSVQLKAPGNETGIFVVSPEFAKLDGKLSSLPNMTKGTVHAYFYFGNQTPEAYMRLYNSSWKYCKDVKFIFDSVGGGWYYGSIPASLFQGYPEGNSSSIIRISILIPAGYTVYLDGLMHYPNEQYSTSLNPDDVFASGIFTANDFSGNSGCKVVTDVTNGSKDAIYMWAENKTGWPTAGVSFVSPLDISKYKELSLDVKSQNSHKWLSIKLGYLDGNGAEQFSEVGMDFESDDWQTVKVRLNQFKNVDLTKITKIFVCVNMEDSFHSGVRNEFWLDNLKLSENATPGNRGDAFKGGENYFIVIEEADYDSISFEYKLVTEGTMSLILRDGTWLKYFGDFTFDSNGEAIDFAGVTTEKLEDGYVRVTLVMDELMRSGVADNRDNAPETIAIFDIYTTTTADGYVDNIQGVLDENEPEEPTESDEPTEPTEPESVELSFNAGNGAYLIIEPTACEAVRFDYKLESAGEMYIVLRDETWLNYFGDYAFNADGYIYSHLPGVYTEKLDNGYIRVTMVLDELTRSGCVDNRDVAPASIAVFDALSWATTNGHMENIEFLMEVPELPNEPEQPTEPEVTEPETTEPEVIEPEVTEPAGLELTFTNGTGGALAVEEGNYDIVRFEYKLESAGELYVVLRDATWLKYFGDYAFNQDGFIYTDLPGVTTEKLDNGYIRVTMVLAELNRTGCVNNLDNAPASIAVFDVLSWTTTNGHIRNIELIKKETFSLTFTAGAGGALAVEEKAYKAIRFDYKLESEGQMYLILRDGSWLKYYGDYAFDNNGFMYGNLPGVTTEKLDNGYIRVTMLVEELNRSGCVDNLNNAPATIAVFDVYSWTTVNGQIENLEFLMDKPAKSLLVGNQANYAKLVYRKPECASLPEQESDGE